MTCRDFEAAWNEILDAETPEFGPAPAGARVAEELQAREDAAAGHAQACHACRTAHRRYQLLREALRAGRARLPLIPDPSMDLAERILADAIRSASRPRRRFLVPLALALAASVAGLLILRTPRTEVPGRPPARAIAPRLGPAMAEATDATWELAMATSQPAARFGLQILDAATGGEDRPHQGPDHDAADPDTAGLIPSVIRSVAPSRSGSDLLQDVGEGLSAGVRPFSARAREAFGFLRTPTLDRAGNTSRRPSSKGA